VDEVRAGLRRRLDLNTARIHYLHIGGNEQVRELGAQSANRVEPNTLDERGSSLENIRAPRGSFGGKLQGTIQFQKVERDLKPRLYV
jgi:hypothetical protein